ncbi:hypothetical protein D6C78_06242 [Aureobasidium pullulans]|uniref:Uncharacterized protein n=1 Tax=Aureobasidium pullulans TaxID=5580 RepID=A0A4T0BLW5_AURPU|nr:hypothetical protein D6C78_06242 [Aureobasidium pullulans]
MEQSDCTSRDQHEPYLPRTLIRQERPHPTRSRRSSSSAAAVFCYKPWSESASRNSRRYRCPGRKKDYAYVSTYTHPEKGATFEEAGCGPGQQVSEAISMDASRLVNLEKQISYRIKGQSCQVMQSREMVYKKMPSPKPHGAWEAVGALSPVPCLVIHGISDYADSHKNDN